MATKTAPLSEAQQQVRRYLQWLADPASLVDTGSVEKLRTQAEAEVDPLERLRLHAELHKTQTVDVDSLRQGFHQYASQLAADEGIPAEAFAALGVPADDLQLAGLVPASRRRGRQPAQQRRRTSTSGASTGGSRSGRKGVLQAVAGLGDEFFTISQLQQLSGASSVTVRRTVEELIEGGKVGEFEPDEAYASRGRAPKRYRMIK